MKVAVLGSSGAMGRFFASYFVARGDEVVGYDLSPPDHPVKGLTLARSTKEAAERADIVLVAVPMPKTLAVVRRVSRHLRKGSTLIEISSVKGNSLRPLRLAVSLTGARLLSIHPLFGPAARRVGMKFCVIGGRSDIASARRLFPRSVLIPMSQQGHDRAMAYVLSLVQLTNLAFLSTIAKGMGLEQFGRAASPIASAQLSVARATLSQDPSLFSSIQTLNPYARETLSSMVGELTRLQGLLAKNDSKGLQRSYEGTSKRQSRSELQGSLRAVYSLV
ncbi:MAG: prephenate dehydrogenase [archaeon]|nr:MAG: prephenate dehydrogenase [archaeon]